MARYRLTVGLMAAACLVIAIKFTSQATADIGSPNDPPVPGLMLAKLASSQTIVAGLVSKNFDQIRRGAQDMVRICDAHQWETNADEVYAHHRKELRREAMKLTQLAGEGNLEGAAFVYTHTVSTCINCHQHCRDVLRIADQRRPKSGVIQIPTSDEHITWPTADGMRR